MADLVTYTREDPVSTITMDDGKVNVFSIAMLHGLHEAFDQAERDQNVVLVKGRPGCFTAGFDLNTLAGPARTPATSSGSERHWPSASSPSRHRSWWPAPATLSLPVLSS
jgi:enoyl-CoA hydratase/carnithine racemase